MTKKMLFSFLVVSKYTQFYLICASPTVSKRGVRTLNASLWIPFEPTLLWLASIRVIVSGKDGSWEMWFSRITTSSSSGRPTKALSSMDVISLWVRSILFSLSEGRWENTSEETLFFIVTPTFKFAFGSELILMYFYSKWKHTHGGKVRLVDLFDSVVASIEVSGVFGERGHTIQIQVIAVDWTTKACAQQANGHTWNTWTRRRKTEKGRHAIVAC